MVCHIGHSMSTCNPGFCINTLVAKSLIWGNLLLFCDLHSPDAARLWTIYNGAHICVVWNWPPYTWVPRSGEWP